MQKGKERKDIKKNEKLYNLTNCARSKKSDKTNLFLTVIAMDNIFNLDRAQLP